MMSKKVLLLLASPTLLAILLYFAHPMLAIIGGIMGTALLAIIIIMNPLALTFVFNHNVLLTLFENKTLKIEPARFENGTFTVPGTPRSYDMEPEDILSLSGELSGKRAALVYRPIGRTLHPSMVVATEKLEEMGFSNVKEFHKTVDPLIKERAALLSLKAEAEATPEKELSTENGDTITLEQINSDLEEANESLGGYEVTLFGNGYEVINPEHLSRWTKFTNVAVQAARMAEQDYFTYTRAMANQHGITFTKVILAVILLMGGAIAFCIVVTALGGTGGAGGAAQSIAGSLPTPFGTD